MNALMNQIQKGKHVQEEAKMPEPQELLRLVDEEKLDKL
jgi:hypothetical protein